MDSDSELIGKGPCPDCGSSDACASYTDGHTHCFSCGKHRRGEDDTLPAPRKTMANKELLPQGEYAPLLARRLTEETCRKWGYTKSTFKGKPVQIATYRDERGQPVAQKVRFPDKTFMVRGDLKQAGLYGQWLWRDGGKMVVVTEGEIDALTVSQLQDLKWPVVSVPNGAQGAAKAVAKSLDWLMKFETVVFMFDTDEPGKAAAQECAELLPPGRAKIANLEPFKDPNEALQKGKGDAVVKAMWDAKAFRPDGIVNGADLWESVRVEDKLFSQALPWAPIQAVTRGIRSGELWMFTSGSGMGKSAVVREIAHHLLMLGQTVGMLMLEETVKRTALGMMGISANHPLHIDREGITEDQLKKAFDETLGTGRLFLYDHFGSTAVENLMARIRYLAKGCGCKFIVLDHLSIVVSGNEDGDERRMIDNTMTALKTLAMECDVALIVVSHLKRPAGDKGHEEGAQTSLSQLRGSHAIAQLSDFVIGLERDQQGENPMVTTIRVLKNRFTGETGVAGYLAYDRSTGRLSETDAPKSSDNQSTGGDDNNEDF